VRKGLDIAKNSGYLQG